MSATEMMKSPDVMNGVPDRWLTVGQAAEIANIKPGTMYSCCLRHALPSYKVGDRMRRIKESDLLAWMESCRVEARKKR